jgi:hypothetical protein
LDESYGEDLIAYPIDALVSDLTKEEWREDEQESM